MSVSTAVANGLHAAFLLARGRAAGLLFVSPDLAGAARSFWAIPVALPPIIVLRVMAWVETGVPAQAGHILLRDLLVYIVSWLFFALISRRMAESLGRGELWPRFISIWNWCNVVGNIMVMAGAIPGFVGAPALVDQVAQLVVMGWALWLEWYAIRLSLAIGPLLAIYFVVLDQVIGLGFAMTGMSFGGG
ncbi:MAG: hypothetical protein AB7O80_08400 [Acetobacteraceae bacterium]